jgi:bromodomain-containing protein 7
MPLLQWVEEKVIDNLTDSRHKILRDTSTQLLRGLDSIDAPSKVHASIKRSLDLYPQVAAQLLSLRALATERIDMASLIRSPEELIESAKEWIGKAYIEARLAKHNALKEEADATQAGKAGMFGYVGATGPLLTVVTEIEGPKMLEYALQWVTQRMSERLQNDTRCVDQQTKHEGADGDVEMKEASDVAEKEGEDSELRKLRINLLALTQYAPLDQIAHIPASLVPVQLRTFVPTIENATITAATGGSTS